jgi:hypothetical protein
MPIDEKQVEGYNYSRNSTNGLILMAYHEAVVWMCRVEEKI